MTLFSNAHAHLPLVTEFWLLVRMHLSQTVDHVISADKCERLCSLSFRSTSVILGDTRPEVGSEITNLLSKYRNYL